jgi:protein-tyrosine phosphatase
VGQIIDFHNHLMPAVDDGARDGREATSGLIAIQEAGVAALITTPHVDASLTTHADRLAVRLEALDAGWTALSSIARDVAPAMPIHRGAELNLDTAQPDLSDSRLRLAGTRFALVEFSFFTIPPSSTRVIRHIREHGWIPVIAHPERYEGIRGRIDICGEWRRAGAFLQLNGPSLTGHYGSSARSAATVLLQRGWADYVSSDYHARGRVMIEDYRNALATLVGGASVTLLMETNPARLLRDEEPHPLPREVTTPGWWSRIAARFR